MTGYGSLKTYLVGIPELPVLRLSSRSWGEGGNSIRRLVIGMICDLNRSALTVLREGALTRMTCTETAGEGPVRGHLFHATVAFDLPMLRLCECFRA